MSTLVMISSLRPDGNWLELLQPAASSARRPALFLDRDGVIVVEKPYLSRPEEVELLPGAATTIAAANRAGWFVVVATNQSGIGRGFYGWDDFAAVQAVLVERLAAAGAALDLVLACAFHEDGQGRYRVADHPWRKPRPGMFEAAIDTLPIDRARSWMVGDHARDLVAAREAGLAGGYHVLTGHGAEQRAAALALVGEGFAVVPVGSIGDVAAGLAGG